MRPRSDNDLFLRRHLAGVAAGATPAWLGALLAHKKGFPKARLMGTRRGFIRERHNTFAWGDRRPGFRHHAVRAVAFIVALSSAIALAGGKHPLEYLDEQTGATVSAVGEPLVFAPERSSQVAAGDYITLAAGAVDRSGDVSYVLIKYCWLAGVSGPSAGVLCAAPLVLQADDRRIELPLSKGSARDAGIGVPIHRPPFGTGTPYVYSVDLETIRLISESHHVSLRIGGDNAPLTYELFEDRRSSLREFVRHMTASN